MLLEEEGKKKKVQRVRLESNEDGREETRLFWSALVVCWLRSVGARTITEALDSLYYTFHKATIFPSAIVRKKSWVLAQRPVDTQGKSAITRHISKFDLVGDISPCHTHTGVLLAWVSGTWSSHALVWGGRNPVWSSVETFNFLCQEMCCQQLHKEAAHQAWAAFDKFSGEVVERKLGRWKLWFWPGKSARY